MTDHYYVRRILFSGINTRENSTGNTDVTIFYNFTKLLVSLEDEFTLGLFPDCAIRGWVGSQVARLHPRRLG
jgi:hypothetical protein